MSQIIATNTKVLSQLNAARAVVNNNCSFRLFQNDIQPQPGTLLIHLVESGFTGYGRINTTSQFGAPFKVLDGLYQCRSNAFVVTPTAGSDEFVYGWMICQASTLLYASRFDEPQPVLNGVPVTVVIELQEGNLVQCVG